MSKAGKTLRSLEFGDVIKTVRTLKFVAVDDGELVFHDVVDDNFTEYVIDDQHTGSLTVEMVKRALRRKPQRQDFKAGDIITGRQVNEVQWKRGTILGHEASKQGLWVLHADGTWQSIDYRYSFDFDCFIASNNYKIIYLP